MEAKAFPRVGTPPLKRRYATDPWDDDFIDLLVRVVEHCIAFDRIRTRRQEASNALLAAQRDLDLWAYKSERYERLEGEPALDDLIHSTEEQVDMRRALLQEKKKEEHRASRALKVSSEQRKRLLNDLYERSQDFINRSIVQKVRCDPLQFDDAFREGLATLAYHAYGVRSERKSLRANRGELLQAYDSESPDGPASRSASKDARRQALTKYRDKEMTLERQEENLLDMEQRFFMGRVYQILVDGDILCELASPRASAASSPSKLSSRSLEQTPSKSFTVDTPAAQKPERLRLQAARKRAAKAKDVLRSIERSDAFDTKIFPGRNNGRSYETIHVEAAEAVRQAEAECDEAWKAAEKAGVTDFPPSPKDLADRSEDGEVASMRAEALRAEDERHREFRPHVDHWNKHVAKSGSPVDPEVAGPRPASAEPGTPPTPLQSRPPTPGIETETSKTRLDRYTRHQEQMQKRAVEQEAERAKRLVEMENEERPAKRRCIIF